MREWRRVLYDPRVALKSEKNSSTLGMWRIFPFSRKAVHDTKICMARRAWVKGRRDESPPWPLKLALAML